MKEKLIDVIKKELTYDATLIYECEHCGHAPKNYWIDHKESLSRFISAELNLKNPGQILEIIEDVSSVSKGDKNEDAESIVSKIDDEVVGIPSL